MKKLLALLLVTATVFSMAACSNKKDEIQPEVTPEVTEDVNDETNESTDATGLQAVYQLISEGYDMPKLMPLSQEELEGFGLTTEDYSDIFWGMSMMNVHATQVVIVEAQEGKLDAVKAALDAYYTDYEAQWATYLPDQYELVQNRQVVENGNTYAVIIGEFAPEMAEKLTAELAQ